MKTKKIILYACILVVCISLSKTTNAQQSKLRVMPQNVQQMQQMAAGGKLTTKIFMAPNKTYGYDILSNGSLIYHQPAMFKTTAGVKTMLTKPEQANLAAAVSMDKLKHGKNPALTTEEVQNVITHSSKKS